jgi:hypothetical protein
VFLTYIQPSIEIWNLQVDEPITTLTDFLLASVSFYAFFKIRPLCTPCRLKWYFRYYFLFLGLGALTGGVLGHAFLYRIAPGWKLVSWVLAIVSVAMMIHAIVEVARPILKTGLTKLIIWVNLLVMSAALFLTLYRLDFAPVKYYTIFGMLLIVGSLSIHTYLKTGSRGVSRFLLAVGLGVVSAVIFSLGWGVSPWFTHNDITHVLLTLSAFIIYKGAALVMIAPASWLPI